MKLNRALQPKPIGNAVYTNSYGLKLVAKAGNISGLHVEDEYVKYMKLPKTSELASMKQLSKVEAEFQGAIDKQSEIEKKALSKQKNKGKKKDDKKGNADAEE